MLDDKELISLLYQTIARDSLKLASVSDDLGVAPETISRWKKSGKLGRSNRDALAVWLASKGVDLEAELMKNRPQSPFSSRRPAECSFDVPPPVFVPLLTVAQAAEVACHTSGDPATNIQAGEQSGFMHPKPGDFAIVVSGSSMMPWYPPGTHILVGRDEIPKTGDRVAAMLAERTEPVFKVFIDHGDSLELLSINERDGLQPIRLNKMDRTEWYWCWPIKESKRDERALDAAMREFGIHHFWEKNINQQNEGK